jgi:hypothetical protein
MDLFSSQSLLFAGDNRLYIAANTREGNDGKYEDDSIQWIVVEYSSSGVSRLYQYETDHSQGHAGTSAALINVNPGAANGGEIVLLGGGTSSSSETSWVLTLNKIDANLGSVT